VGHFLINRNQIIFGTSGKNAEMLGARQWWSLLKNSAVGQVMGWVKSCFRVFELKAVSKERELILLSPVEPRLTHFHPTPCQISTRWTRTRLWATALPGFAKQARISPEGRPFRTE
jgi:hypothetical protein